MDFDKNSNPDPSGFQKKRNIKRKTFSLILIFIQDYQKNFIFLLKIFKDIIPETL